MVGGYALIGIAASERGGAAEKSESLPEPRGILRVWDRLRGRLRRIEERWLPLASTVALIVFLFADWSSSGAIDPLLAVLTATLSLLLILREGVIAGQAELEGYTVLLDNLEDPAFICNQAGRVLLENPAMRAKYSPGRKNKMLRSFCRSGRNGITCCGKPAGAAGAARCGWEEARRARRVPRLAGIAAAERRGSAARTVSPDCSTTSRRSAGKKNPYAPPIAKRKNRVWRWKNSAGNSKGRCAKKPPTFPARSISSRNRTGCCASLIG